MKRIHNQKQFLVPDSPRTMASYHAKVMDDGIMKLTIHDCKGAIQLHNDLNDPEQVTEAIEKLETLAQGIYALQFFIAKNYLKNEQTKNLRNSTSIRNN